MNKCTRKDCARDHIHAQPPLRHIREVVPGKEEGLKGQGMKSLPSDMDVRKVRKAFTMMLAEEDNRAAENGERRHLFMAIDPAQLGRYVEVREPS